MISVIGDSIIDIYYHGVMDRRSPESPILIFNQDYTETKQGGSSNVVANLQALGQNPKHYFSTNSTKFRYVCDNTIVFRADKEEYVANTVCNFNLQNGSDTFSCVS